MSIPEKPIPQRQNEVREGENNRGDGWAIRIVTIHGIPIRLHFTFLLLLAYIAFVGWGHGGFVQIGFIVGVFACVVLHELGHSLVAQGFGYGVRDIVLYPIGGIASIEETPKPIHELWIAVAGPAVNVVIATIIALWMTFVSHAALQNRIMALFEQVLHGNGAPIDSDYGTLLLWANIMLVVFNLIPAFPMDGGRVLRAALALRIGRLRATRAAATIGQVIAFLLGMMGLGFFGLHANFMLVIVALFVYFAAGQERLADENKEVIDDATIREAMMSDFVTLSHGDTLKHAADVLLAGSQQDFPVMSGSDIVGMLSRSALLRGLARDGDSAYVAAYMDREVLFASPNDPLEEYLLSTDALRRSPVLVRDPATQSIVGMVTLENAMEFLTLRQISRLREANEPVSIG